MFVAVVVVAASMFVVTRTASAASGGTLTLAVTSGSAGTRVQMNATGFLPGEQVQPYWDYSGPGTGIAQNSFYLYSPVVTAGPTGSALTDLFVPVVPGGSYPIALVGLTSGIVDTANFTVTPRLETGSVIAPQGSVLRLTGWGFGSRESVTISWPGVGSVKATTDHGGHFSLLPPKTTLTVPSSLSDGNYTVTATGASSGLQGSAAVSVTSIPSGPPPLSTDWPQFGWDLQQHRVNPNETKIGPANVGQLGLAWQQNTPYPDVVQASPTVANGIVYMGTTHGLVEAYSATSGTLLWSFQANGPIYGSPNVVNGIAYFGTVNEPQQTFVGNYAYALDATTGAVIWENPLPNGGEWTAPLVVNGTVVFPMANREAVSGGEIAYNALTGATIWEFNTPYGIWGEPSVSPDGSTLYQGTGNPCFTQADPQPGDGCSGYVLAIDITTGTYTTLIHTPDYSGDDDIATAVTYDNGNLYFGGKNGIFYSISATTGAINWQYTTLNQEGFFGDSGIYSSGALSDADNMVYFGSGDGYVHALYATGPNAGTLAWQTHVGGGPLVSSPSMANGVLYAASESGPFDALDPTTGQILWTTNLGAPTGGSAAIANGVVYQTVGNGGLDAFTIGSQAPAILGANSTTGYVGNKLSFVFRATGTPATTITESGALPTGVSFSTAVPYPTSGSPQQSDAAELVGTPAAGTQGSYPLTITAHNGAGPDAKETFTLVVAGTAPSFTSPSSAQVAINQTFSVPVTVTGAPAPTLYITGTLPPGVTFTSKGLGQGALSGTPTTSGTYTIEINATNHVGAVVTQAFTLTVSTSASSAPSITSAASTTDPVGASSAFTVTTSGSPTPTISESGALPGGMKFADNGNGTATLSGTPAAGTVGTYPLTFTATNGVSPNATQNFTLTVDAPAAITSASSTTFAVGDTSSFTVRASGSPTPAITESGTLPSGLSLKDNGNGTATLSGKPAAGSQGSYPVVLAATNGVGTAATQNFTLTVGNPVAATITSAAAATFTVGNSSTFTITTTGAPTPTITESGAFPGGVTLVDNGNGTATLSGTPAAGSATTYPITITAANGVGPPASQSFILSTGVTGNADVEAILTGPGTATLNQSFQYGLAVKNLGPDAATGVQATFTLPAGVTFDSASPTATPVSGTLTWSVPSISSGADVKYRITVTPTQVGLVVASASVEAATPDSNSANNAASVTVKVIS